jgi:hypothetical protein
LRIRLEAIDSKTVDVVDSSLTWLGRTIFRSAVHSGIQDELKNVSVGWSAKPLEIPGDLPLPPDMMGQKFKVYRMKMDKNGYLVMLLNFASRK